jgi:hypothetical protein
VGQLRDVVVCFELSKHSESDRLVNVTTRVYLGTKIEIAEDVEASVSERT